MEPKALATLVRNQTDSSVIKSIGYNNGILEVEFKKTGKKCQYLDVPQAVFEELMKATSKGVYFNAHIRKGNFKFNYID